MKHLYLVLSLIGLLSIHVVGSQSTTTQAPATQVQYSTTADDVDEDDDGFILDEEDVQIPAAESAPERDLHHQKLKMKMKHQKGQQPIQMQPMMIQRPILVQQVPVPQVTQRVEVQRIIKEKSCPSGMDLVGDQCIGTQIVSPNYVCPPSTVMTNGECLSIARPRVDCPPGFDLRGGRCVSCESIPAQFTCRNPDQFLDGSGMGCISTIPQPPICPPGFRMVDGNQCVQLVPSQLQCPPGYTLSAAARQCIQSVTFPASIVCPDGATLNPATQKCVIIKQAPPRCPHRFTFDSAAQSCVKRVSEVPADCPIGFHRVGNSCEKVDRYPSDQFCPSDYIMNHDGSCIKEVPIPPQCPAGYQHSSNSVDMCERIVKEIPICPEGTTAIGSGASLRCQSTNEHDIIQCCPPGFELDNGRCRRLEYLVPTLSCENECYKVRATKVAYICPDGAEFVDHPNSPKCIRRIPSQQCTQPRFDAPITQSRCLSQQKNEKESNGELRRLHGDSVYVDCEPIPTPPAPVCVNVPKEEVMIAQPYCPDGGEIDGDHCVVRDPIIPERICQVGRMDESTGQCVREQIVPVKTECPAGTIRQGMRCVSFNHHEPQMVCPEGSETGSNGCCVAYSHSILSAPKVIRAPSARRCSTGQLSANNECIEVTKVPQAMICPVGSMDTGMASSRCVETAELIIPQPIEKLVRPSYICPDGSRARGCDCHSTESVQPESICVSDSTFDGQGNCIRSAQVIIPPPRTVSSVAIPVCPSGTEMRGTRCITNHEVEAIVSCPNGYDYDGHQCTHTCPSQAVCPIGMTQASDGCIRQTFAPPMVRIVQGCSHELVPSCSGCPRDVTSTCHHV